MSHLREWSSSLVFVSSFIIILPYATEEVFMLSQILKYDNQISES